MAEKKEQPKVSLVKRGLLVDCTSADDWQLMKKGLGLNHVTKAHFAGMKKWLPLAWQHKIDQAATKDLHERAKYAAQRFVGQKQANTAAGAHANLDNALMAIRKLIQDAREAGPLLRGAGEEVAKKIIVESLPPAAKAAAEKAFGAILCCGVSDLE